jgi:alkaline phosphatase D
MMSKITRRQFLATTTLTGASLVGGTFLAKANAGDRPAAPGVIPASRPGVPYGVMSGDVTQGSAVIWSRSDRPARMMVEYAFDPSFRRAERLVGPTALDSSDYTARIRLRNLPDGRRIFYRVQFQDLDQVRSWSEPVIGSFQTVPNRKKDITFVWSGDQAGQGWGINPAFGGMKIFETMRQMKPDFFIHSGDTIYADNPIQAEVPLPDGSIWRNVTIPEKAKVAETLQEFRGNYRYNLMDEHFRRFNAEVPMMSQWDDHENTNNWYPNEILTNTGGDTRYTEKNVNVLAGRARQAFLEYMPIALNRRDPQQIYRSFDYGALLEVFMIDERSYRGDNTRNRQTTPDADTPFLGSRQIQWLQRGLLKSRATWKVIASDMPLGLIVTDNPNAKTNGLPAYEALANGDDGVPLGRELEIANLLRFIKRNRIRNVVWLTADVHYCASHYYDPNQAAFQDFHPFWEFVSGPLNAGSFGPNALDKTFGPEVKFQSAPPAGQVNLPPTAGLQFFGVVKIDSDRRVMTVSHYDIDGKKLWSIDLQPEA